MLSNLFIVAAHYTHINACNVLLLLLSVPLYTMLSTAKESEQTNHVAIVHCTHVGQPQASLSHNIAQENITADILAENQLRTLWTW